MILSYLQAKDVFSEADLVKANISLIIDDEKNTLSGEGKKGQRGNRLYQRGKIEQLFIPFHWYMKELNTSRKNKAKRTPHDEPPNVRREVRVSAF